MKKKGRKAQYIGADKGIRKLYLSKKGFKSIGFEDFKNWYNNQSNCCCYCGLTKDEALILFNKYPKSTRGGKRGKSLEIDRKDPHLSYSATLDNLVLSCYWCNNAKTNYFSYNEFMEIGKSIGKFQQNRLLNLRN